MQYIDGVPKVGGGETSILSASRPFLESRIRAELLGRPNVSVVTDRVTGLEFDGPAVTGVRGEATTYRGDLVVDASGRASHVGDWLARAGWDKPPTTRVATGIHYATAYFRRRTGVDHDIRSALAFPSKIGPEATGATFSAVEGGRWIVMVGGYGDARPGRTAEDLITRFRRDYPAPFGEAVAGEMLGDVTTYRQADSLRRDYWAAPRLPARLIAVGDAVASFNPLYGQGMSSAALHASALSAWLRSGAPTRDFFARQKVVVDAAWAISTSNDRAGVAGWFSERIVDASITDPVVNAAFLRVTNMIDHPDALRRPDLLWRTLRARSHGRPARVPSFYSIGKSK